MNILTFYLLLEAHIALQGVVLLGESVLRSLVVEVVEVVEELTPFSLLSRETLRENSRTPATNMEVTLTLVLPVYHGLFLLNALDEIKYLFSACIELGDLITNIFLHRTEPSWWNTTIDVVEVADDCDPHQSTFIWGASQGLRIIPPHTHLADVFFLLDNQSSKPPFTPALFRKSAITTLKRSRPHALTQLPAITNASAAAAGKITHRRYIEWTKRRRFLCNQNYVSQLKCVKSNDFRSLSSLDNRSYLIRRCLTILVIETSTRTTEICSAFFEISMGISYLPTCHSAGPSDRRRLRSINNAAVVLIVKRDTFYAPAHISRQAAVTS
ncbi:hypothetical protein EVAR_83724_1 [Eumeta japonica]|uniref:Uncharacterized protein n=1 Tax=Eumeta variegata TaxID=151549 RepID=A0A4C1WC11_EUMVA|nr:hypothetical protein EVAR_83724_1 [Eumeta japonica]